MSNLSLQNKTFFGFDAWQLQNDRFSVVVVPAVGGKIVSLYDKSAGIEWLVQPENAHIFRTPEYGAPYESSQCGGWDEMMPTIVACSYPVAGEHQGVYLPDHGELWVMPWREAGSNQHAIRLVVDGVALPYRLHRTLIIHDKNTLRFEYLLQNLGKEALVYLWTPHPQFQVEPDAIIELPPEVDQVVNVLPDERGAVGVRNLWPVIFEEDGIVRRQDRIASISAGRGRKFYLPPECPISWVKLQQPSGATLRMTWRPKDLPYCGIWIDEGKINSVSTVTIEPATGYYDDLSLALSNGMISALPARGEHSWSLEISFFPE